MSNAHIFIAGLRPIHDRAVQPWLRRTSELALAFSREVHGDEPASHGSDLMVLHMVACALWRCSRGKPCWSQLDPDVLDAELGHVAVWRLMGAGAYLTLYSFLCFLAKHDHLSPDAAVASQERLQPYVAPFFAPPPRRARTALPSLLN